MREQTTLGIDVGSAAVKAVIMRSAGGDNAGAEMIGHSCQRIRRRDLHETIQAAIAEAGQGRFAPNAFDYVATTGEADAVEFRTGHFYTITTHARGALYFNADAAGALDVGSLHARAIRLDPRGKVTAQRMTSQCASGSGQFLENIARYLGVPIEDVGELSRTAKAPEMVSGICAVLAETDVINMVSRGISTADILKGIHLSIAGRLVQLVRAIGTEGQVVVTGGLATDTGLLAALQESADGGGAKKRPGKQVNVKFVTHPEGVLAGAIGAALLGAYRYRQLEETGKLAMLTGGYTATGAPLG
jgi:benzoyl-CoA reductase subunit D